MIGDKNTFYTVEELRKFPFKSLGKDVRISKLANIRFPELVSIGDHVAIGPFVYISVQMDIGNRVEINPNVTILGSKKSYCKLGDYTFISSGTVLLCGSDDYSGSSLIGRMVPESYRNVTYGKIILEKFSGIGCNCVIFPNVTIKEGTVIGACSMLKETVEPWSIYYGIPAIKKGNRKKDIIQLSRWIEIEEENIDMKFEKLVVIVSITDQNYYEKHLGKSLENIGVPYTLIKTCPNIPYTKSYNSIIKYKNLKDSKYLLFVHQDVEFLEDNWGKKLLDICDNLPNLGYAGTECVTESGEIIGYGYAFSNRKKWGHRKEGIPTVQTCDGGIALIPTKLFLERQFDETFLWYPVHEDYACWVQYVKGLKVYCLPIETWHIGGGKEILKEIRLSSKKKRKLLFERYKRVIYTTGDGRGGIKP
jgi:galactoside O-acetyltransferase